MKGATMTIIKEDIAELKADVKYLVKGFDEMKEQYIKLEERVSCTEKDQSSLSTRLSIISTLQVGISIIVGAVASFLGAKK